MQVNDAPPPSPRASATDELPGGEPRRGSERGRGKGRFRGVLQAATDDASARPNLEITTGAALGGWFRPESPRAASPVASPPLGPRAVDRVLVGTSGETTEARIRIGAGPLAGTEISVSAAPGARVVEAALLTCAAGSRQTLSLAMDEIRLRLRAKGIVLEGSSAPRRGDRPRQPLGADGAWTKARDPESRE